MCLHELLTGCFKFEVNMKLIYFLQCLSVTGYPYIISFCWQFFSTSAISKVQRILVFCVLNTFSFIVFEQFHGNFANLKMMAD